MKKITILIFLVAIFQLAPAQNYTALCTWNDLNQLSSKSICEQDFQTFAFNKKNKVYCFIDSICNAVALENHFSVMECDNIYIAKAMIGKDPKNQNLGFVIGYNSIFFNTLKNNQTNYESISILAHEMGHHVNGNTLNGDIPREVSLTNELAADKFSGYVMARLKYSLDQAQAAIKKYVTSEKDDETHPGRSKRLTAIENGYTTGMSDSKYYSKVETMSKPNDETLRPIGVEVRKADSLFVIGDIESGLRIYNRLIKEQSDKRIASIILSELGFLYYEDGSESIKLNGKKEIIDIGKSDKKAKELFKQALDLWPDNIEAITSFFDLANNDAIEKANKKNVDLNFNDYGECIKWINIGITASRKLNFEPIELYGDLFGIYKDCGMYDKIIEAATSAHDNSPSYYSYLTDIGEAYWAKGNYDKAHYCFKESYGYAKIEESWKTEFQKYNDLDRIHVAKDLIVSCIIKKDINSAKTILNERINRLDKIENKKFYDQFIKTLNKVNDKNFDLKKFLSDIDWDKKDGSPPDQIRYKLFE